MIDITNGLPPPTQFRIGDSTFVQAATWVAHGGNFYGAGLDPAHALEQAYAQSSFRSIVKMLPSVTLWRITGHTHLAVEVEGVRARTDAGRTASVSRWRYDAVGQIWRAVPE